MRLLYLFFFSLLSHYSFSQKNVDTTFYPNGQINTRDSVFENGKFKLHEQYYSDILKFKNDTFFLKQKSSLNAIESKGLYLNIGTNNWMQYGKWTYWSIKGFKLLETFSNDGKKGSRYINQWIPSGKQILNNGNGYYYQIGMERATDYGPDSTVYEIKDSLKDGTYCVWCPLKNGKYYKCETGQYFNNYRQSLQISFFINGQVQRLEEYKNSKLEGEYHSFYDNGKYSQFGSYSKGQKVNNWKYWNDSGYLIKEANYYKGELIGNCSEYYPNGTLKSKGSYIQISDSIEVTSIDVLTGEETIYSRNSDTVPVKNGDWFYYSSDDRLTKTELYLKGKHIKK
jgi:antitoxin component YwqK of YwqJK toxin-antitoxin module